MLEEANWEWRGVEHVYIPTKATGWWSIDRNQAVGLKNTSIVSIEQQQ